MKTLTIIIGIFAVLMGFLTISAVYQEAYSQAQDGASLDICRNSVLLRDQATITTAQESLEKITPLQCPTEDVDPDGITKDEEIERVSDLMSKCWYMFAEGRSEDIFQTDPGERTCHVCYQYLPDNEGITSDDLISFMQSKQVNPTSFRSVNSQSHLGDGVDLSELPPTEPATTIQMESIAAPDAIDFVDDPANYVSDTQEQTINDNLRTVFTEANITGNIVISYKIQGLSRGSVHDLMQRVNLVEGNQSTSGFYLTISVSDKQARLDLTPDLQTTIPEQSISKLLEPLRSTTSLNQDRFGEALVATSENIEQRFVGDTDLSVERGSYYSYLTQGRTGVFLPDELEKGTPYAISYVSPSNDQESFNDVPYLSWFSRNDLEGVPTNHIQLIPYSDIIDTCNVRS